MVIGRSYNTTAVPYSTVHNLKYESDTKKMKNSKPRKMYKLEIQTLTNSNRNKKVKRNERRPKFASLQTRKLQSDEPL